MIIENQEFIKTLAAHNTALVRNSTFDHSKLLEELIELSEVLIKHINKAPQNQPTEEKIVEELGDVLFRCELLMLKHGLEDAVKERIKHKSEKLQQYLDEGKYKTSI